MREERLKILRDSGKILVENFGGSFVNCVKQSKGSAMKLLELITTNFECYNDSGIFENRVQKF